MKAQFVTLFVLLVMLSGTAFSRSYIPGNDSTKLYTIPQWRVDRMINEVISSRLSYEMCVKTNEENRLLKKQSTYLDSAYVAKCTQVSELQDANKAQSQALSSSGTAIQLQGKEIKKQKRLKWLFGGIAILVIIIDHAK